MDEYQRIRYDLQTEYSALLGRKNHLSGYLNSVPGLKLPEYYRRVVETQLRAMNLELECLKLRLEGLQDAIKA